MSYKIVFTSSFESNVKQLSKKYPSLKSDLDLLFDALYKNPSQGDSLGRSCYKIRLHIKSKGKGKSAGGRVITYVVVRKQEIVLLAIYDKSEKSTISQTELSQLLNQIEK